MEKTGSGVPVAFGRTAWHWLAFARRGRLYCQNWGFKITSILMLPDPWPGWRLEAGGWGLREPAVAPTASPEPFQAPD